MKGFKNVKVYITGEGIKTLSVGVENGKIAYIGEDAEKITEPYPYKEGQTVIPGFVDEHIHGAVGSDAMDASEEALSAIASALPKEGTTTFLATTMTQSPERIKAALKNACEYIEKDNKEGARVLGVHLEGPYICDKFKGAQPGEYIAKPESKSFDDYYETSGGNIKLVTMAPENDEGYKFIEYLCSKGITVSAGHSDATFETVREASEKGVKCITHTYNGQRGLHHRDIGVVGGAFSLDNVATEIICDLIHVSAPAIKLLIKNKPHDKVILITDAMRAKGLEDGISELGGQTVYVKNGEARLENGALAGSTLKMNVAVKNLVKSCGVPFCGAVDFATINPAKNLGVDKLYGSIEEGKFADFTVLDGEFNVQLTVRGGEVVYNA